MRLDEQITPEHETSARVRRWALLRGSEMQDIDRERAVVFVSISPLEVHGPHLPLCTDILEARALAMRCMERLSARFEEIEFLELPSLFVATDVVPQPGSLQFRPSTITRVVEDMGRSLAAQGFEHVWISSFHGGPRHWLAIEQGVANVNRRHGAKALSLFSMLLGDLAGGNLDLADALGHIPGSRPDILKRDQHAGMLETSLMKHLLGDYVLPHEHLPPRYTDEHRSSNEQLAHAPWWRRAKMLVDNARSGIRYYEKDTYSGAPGLGTAELGAAFFEEISRRASDSLADVWTQRRGLDECHSPLWPMRWLILNEPIVEAYLKLVGQKTQVF